MKNSIIYQLLPRVFTSGGTLKAAEKMIPYLADLGIDYIYLCPVFEQDDDPNLSTWSPRQVASGCDNPKNPYKIKNYYAVDAEYGTTDDLKDFISKAHEYSLKVMLDLVYLHCGANAVFIKEHPDWVRCDESGKPLVGETWPFARINYKSGGVREYLLQNMEYYARDFKADGFRCDVGDEVPLDFWLEGRKRVEKINPDIIMLDEGRNPEYVKSGAFDLLYCYHSWNKLFQEPPAKKHFCGLMQSLADIAGVHVSFLENHDVASDCGDNRYEAVLGAEKIEICLMLLYFTDGIPLLWNGNEIGDSSVLSMFSNRFCANHKSIDWSKALTPEGKKRLDFIKELNRIRHEHPMLIDAKMRILPTADDSVIAFERENAESKIFVCVNCSDKQFEFSDGLPENFTALIQRRTEINENALKLGACGFIAAETK